MSAGLASPRGRRFSDVVFECSETCRDRFLMKPQVAHRREAALLLAVLRKVGSELLDGAVQPVENGLAGKATVDEIALGHVDPGCQRLGFEEGKERTQLMLDDERVLLAAAGRCEQDRLAGKPGRVDKIEEMLEETRIAALDRKSVV